MRHPLVIFLFVLLLPSCGDTGNQLSTATIEKVIETGVLDKAVSERELQSAAIVEIDNAEKLLADAKIEIFNLNPDGTVKIDGSSLTNVDWDPTHDAALLEATLGLNTPLLISNNVTDSNYVVQERQLAVIGHHRTGRYVVMGSNPFRNLGSSNSEMNTLMLNILKWLTKRSNLADSGLRITLSQLDESYYFKDESSTRTWLDTFVGHRVSYNDIDRCDGEALAGCLNQTDLLIISQVSRNEAEAKSVSSIVKGAMQKGLPVLYVHHDGDLKKLGEILFSDVFRVNYFGDNYWRKLRLTSFDGSDALKYLSENFSKIRTMLQSLDDEQTAYDWSMCRGENCSEVSGFKDDFLPGAQAAKTYLRELDAGRNAIFEVDGYRVARLLTLLGDRLREKVSFPLDREDPAFLKAYLADHLVYNYRTQSPAMKDMGNFSRSDFSHVTPTTKTVNLISRRHFRSAGVYALPGQTFRVTRHDASNLTVNVFVNTIREGATHEFAPNGYSRPKFLRTPEFKLEKGRVIAITSPYGGPIQLGFSANDLEVSVTFEGVGEHPHWRSSSDDVSFAERLEKAEFDWAEVATNGFEVHSKIDKMKSSISDAKWGSAAVLAAATERYMYNYPHVLAGFKGQGIDVVSEIDQFARDLGLTIETLDTVKHMNADQATCGYGCSGNPYDAYWNYDPIGHGDVHELGHGLEKFRFRFEGWEFHSTTNPYSYYTKSRYNENTAGEPSCQNLPFKNVFEKLQSSKKEADPDRYLKENLWDISDWSQQFMVTLQAMMQAQKIGELVNGWHLLARMHILEREINRAKNDWDNRRSSLGFSTYSLEEFNHIRNNDWLLVSLSFAAKLDYRNFLSMMGLAYSDQAAAQVASFGYELVPETFFVSTPNGYCKTDHFGRYLDKKSVPVDGYTVWPE